MLSLLVVIRPDCQRCLTLLLQSLGGGPNLPISNQVIPMQGKLDFQHSGAGLFATA